MKRILPFLFHVLFGINLFAQIQVSTFESVDSIKIDDGLILDNEGNLYGSHFEGSRVYKITPQGDISVFVDSLNGPNGLAFDSSGNLFVVEHKGNKVYKVLPDGTKSVFLSSIHRPSGIIKLPDSDTMLITRYYADIILKVAPDGSMDTLAMDGLLNGPVGLVYDELGELYVGNFDDRKIIHIEKDGTQSHLATIPGGNYLGFLTYGNGVFYGTSFQLSQIYKVTKADSMVSLVAGTTQGSVDGPVSVAQFHSPNGILLSPTRDSLYISDYGSGNVRIISGLNPSVGIENSNVDNDFQFSVYPNPFQDEITLEIKSVENERVYIRLLDMSGRILYNQNSMVSSGLTNLKIQLDSFSKGIFWIQISGKNFSLNKSIVK